MTGGTEKRKRPYQKSNAHEKRQGGDQTYVNSPIVKAFEQYSAELHAKHDKYERIVKLSRDVTILSKRIIYAIHALMRSSNYNEDVDKIKESFKTIQETLLKAIAKELENDDQYQFIKAYFWGVQEYIEALTFFHYIDSGKLFNFEDLLENLTYQIEVESVIPENSSGTVTNEVSEVAKAVESIDSLKAEGDALHVGKRTLHLHAQIPDYILGVQDLTGELMRHCINCFAANRTSGGYSACDFVKRLFSGMIRLSNIPSKEFTKKFTVCRQSLEKMEMACYTTRVRGSEAVTFHQDQVQDDIESYSYYD